MASSFSLDTPRQRLYLSHPDLAPAVSAYLRRNRAFLTPFQPLRPPGYEKEEQQRVLLQEDVDAYEVGTGLRLWLAPRKSADEIIGFAHLSNIVRGAFCSCFLGYQLDAAHKNQGYMTEALEQVMALAFGPLGLHRVEANIMPRNRPSLRVAEKLGFHSEGISPRYLAIQGVWEDHVHMVRLNEELPPPM